VSLPRGALLLADEDENHGVGEVWCRAVWCRGGVAMA
jgi:hypothetical protein